MRMHLYCGVVLVLSNGLLLAQSGQSNSPTAQPRPAPASAVAAPAPQDQVQKLQDILTRPVPKHKPDDPVPSPSTIYHIFFMHLAQLDSVAAKMEAGGKSGNHWRTHDQVLAGLTAAEGDALKKVAYDCNQAMAEQNVKIQNEITSIRRQSPKGQGLTPTPELDQLWSGRAQIINSYIGQLHSRLGETSFKKLDAYVKRNFVPTKIDLSAAK